MRGTQGNVGAKKEPAEAGLQTGSKNAAFINRREPGPMIPPGAGGLTNPKESNEARTATFIGWRSNGASAGLQKGETVISPRRPDLEAPRLYF